MPLRFLSASVIYPSVGKPVKDGVLVMEDERVVEITESSKVPEEKIEYFDGFLCPGFVNTHCHLELSHLHRQIEKHTSLPGFIGQILGKRALFSEELIWKAAAEADHFMFENGIVAVGDISNTDHTLAIKKSSSIHYHTFVEIFDLDERNAQSVFDSGKEIMNRFHSAGLAASLVPHAPYSVSPALMKMLVKACKKGDVVSIHNQENGSENALFRSRSGALYDLFQRINTSYASWVGNHFTSLAYTLSFIDHPMNFLLVHNTYSTFKDVEQSLTTPAQIFWGICARANEYIENTFPPVRMLCDSGAVIVLGTDSLASNETLSILDEMIFIHSATEHVSVEKLLRWATINGAYCLNIENRFGSFEKGKRPGVNLIEQVDVKAEKLIPTSKVRKIV